MAIAHVRTDDWIQHLPFVGGPRPSPYGSVDGMFYGALSVAGDVSGGNLTLNGNLSEARKEDWVYIIGGTQYQKNTVLAGEQAFEIINTGPVTPTASAVVNPSFPVGALMDDITNNAVTIGKNDTTKPFIGMPAFGDKRIAGVFSLYAVGFENNTDTVLHTASIWGWIIRYNSFFRDVRPSVG